MTGKFPGWRTMTAAQRRNAKAEAIFAFARSHGHTAFTPLPEEQERLRAAAVAQGWRLGDKGWYHPEHDDLDNDPPFPTLEKLDAYAHLLEN